MFAPQAHDQIDARTTSRAASALPGGHLVREPVIIGGRRQATIQRRHRRHALVGDPNAANACDPTFERRRPGTRGLPVARPAYAASSSALLLHGGWNGEGRRARRGRADPDH